MKKADKKLYVLGIHTYNMVLQNHLWSALMMEEEVSKPPPPQTTPSLVISNYPLIASVPNTEQECLPKASRESKADTGPQGEI